MMHRRAGKNAAHIAPPIDPSTDNTHYDAAKSSRFGQKTLGLTNRIWLILGLFFFILLVTRYSIPHDSLYHSSSTRHTNTNTNLKPINYLNVSTEGELEIQGTPFEFCPVFGPGDEVGAKHGLHALQKSRVHLGSGARVQRVIHKALSGLPVTISVLGGSVSACHGAGDDPISPKCYPSKFFQWWNSVFPNPASELTNGAMRRTNSAYFSFCNVHHLPDFTDLVILEFDVDDPRDDAWLDHFELLVRSILLRPNHPAVVLLGHFSPQVQTHYSFHGPEVLHNVVAQFYDLPHISIKPILYPSWISDPDSIKPHYVDSMLASPTGHDLMADVLIHYFQSQICSAWNAVTGRSFEVLAPALGSTENTGIGQDQPLTDLRGVLGGIGQRPDWFNDVGSKDTDGSGGDERDGDGDNGGSGSGDLDALGSAAAALHVPKARIRSRPADLSALSEVTPHCVSANDLINPLPPSLFYGSGWYAFHPAGGSSRIAVTSHYWYSEMPTSKFRVPLKVGAGDIGVYYLLEPRDKVGEGSEVECWVDDNYAGARTISNAGDVGDATATLEMIDHGVSRGSHFVECQLIGEEGRSVPRFRLLGIFTT